MVRLRLRRTGARNKACFRIVAADKRSPRNGRFIEVIGYYDPRHQDENIDLERAEYWLGQGAQPSETVSSIIARAKSGKPMAPPPPPPKPEGVNVAKPAAKEKAEKAPAKAKAEKAAKPEAAAEPAPAEAAAEPAPAVEAEATKAATE